MRRSLLFVASVALLASPLAFEVRAEEVVETATEQQEHLCGENDLPEEEDQLQGDVPKRHRVDDASGVSRAEKGYNCGLALVGRTSLKGVDGRDTENANMAWAKDCAYVAGSSAAFGGATPNDANGVAVVDVRNPRRPRHVMTLNQSTVPDSSAASTTVLETLHARETADGRALLVVGTYGNQSGGNKPMDVYDVSDCASPRFLTTIWWTDNIHNLTISEDLRYVFATQPLQVVDLADPAHEVRNLEEELPEPLLPVGPYGDLDDDHPDEIREARTAKGYSSHEAWPVVVDGRQLLYLGGQLPTFEAFTIVDITDWLHKAGPPVVLSQREGRGHSLRTATIDGRRYALHSEESVFGGAYGCVSEELNPFAGAAEPFLSDVTDPAAPTLHLSQFHLEINEPRNCAAQYDSRTLASVHYHDFDRPDDARFAMLSMWNAGVRVIDVRDPAHPREVAYFNPGDVNRGTEEVIDKAWGHVRYKDGYIWLATESGGFWVLELEPQVRDHFDIDVGGAMFPKGAPGTVGVQLGAIAPASVETTSMYCTLGGVTAAS